MNGSRWDHRLWMRPRTGNHDVGNGSDGSHKKGRGGWRGGLARAVTRPLSWMYRGAVAQRNGRFDRGVDVHRVDAPVVCVGNLTTGGTGKTPVVADIATRLRRRGVAVAIVSRGYRSEQQSGGLNDEALELYDRLDDVPQVHDADRVAAATIAVEELQSQFVLMDDGFGHRRLHRDADIVLIDATCPFGYGHLLPRGLLREPLSSLSRASLVMLTRTDLVCDDVIATIETVVRRHTDAAIIRTVHAPTSLISHPDRSDPIDVLRGARVVALSAIGNPAAFTSSLERLGAEVVDRIDLPDHDAFDRNTLTNLKQRIIDIRQRTSPRTIDRIVCTHKDLVKLRTDRLAGVDLAAVRIDVRIIGDDGPLEDLLVRVLNQHVHV